MCEVWGIGCSDTGRGDQWSGLMRPRQTLEAFDDWLWERSLRLDAVVVGGAALALLDVSTRQTRDVDILDPRLTVEVLEAARAFAEDQRMHGVELDSEWLNNGPLPVAALLPDGWRQRLRPVFAGRAIELSSLGHLDLLKTKPFALCDRGTDLSDCVAM
jgi:hypothetical protein